MSALSLVAYGFLVVWAVVTVVSAVLVADYAVTCWLRRRALKRSHQRGELIFVDFTKRRAS